MKYTINQSAEENLTNLIADAGLNTVDEVSVKNSILGSIEEWQQRAGEIGGLEDQVYDLANREGDLERAIDKAMRALEGLAQEVSPLFLVNHALKDRLQDIADEMA